MNCPVCGSGDTNREGKVTPYTDYSVDVFRCGACKARFAARSGEEAHEQLHAGEQSTYRTHYTEADKWKCLLDRSGKEALREQLSETPKYRFVLDAVERLPASSSILELGCSTGVLGAYFSAAGYCYTGVDISPTAIEAARQFFGPNYYTLEQRLDWGSQRFDVICFVGTIGCVDSPAEFIDDALSLLNPGGFLLFNAPNVDACDQFGEMWVSGAMPPDLVTVFHRGSWCYLEKQGYQVSIDIGAERPENVLRKKIRKVVSGSTLPVASVSLRAGNVGGRAGKRSSGNRKVAFRTLRSLLSRLYHSAINVVASAMYARRYSAEFGLYVTVCKPVEDSSA